MSEGALSSGYSRVKAYLGGIRHPFLVMLAVGVIVRLLCMSMSMGYDADYWAVVIRNIEAGDGLYDAEGYYYTPVWGYILGLISVLQDLFLSIGESAVRVIQAFPVEGLDQYYLSATATSVAFNYSVKIPLMIFDLVLAYLVRVLVRDVCGDDRKANLAFALTFLCPVVIGSSGIIGMPDTVAAMFTVLTIVLLRRDAPLLAGAAFSIAVLTKFFPVFLIFIFVAYIVVRNRGNRRRTVTQLSMAVIGAVVAAAIIFLPQILAGDLSQCFQFLTDRTGSSEGQSFLDYIIGQSRVIIYAVVLILSVYIGYRMLRVDADGLESALMRNCLLVTTLVLVYPPTTQYIVIMIPFLAYWIAVGDAKYLLSWKILAVGSVVYMFSSNALMFLSLAQWTDMVSVDSVMDIFNAYTAEYWGLVPMSVQFVIGGVLQCLGILSVLYLMYGDRIRALITRRRGDGVTG